MGLRSRIKGRLKKLLDDAQSRQSKPAGFDVRVTERPPAFRGRQWGALIISLPRHLLRLRVGE